MLLLIPEIELVIKGYEYDLHSTMLLLIRRNNPGEFLRICIYIPLCFYLYTVRQYRQESSESFTFHYASTYTAADYGAPTTRKRIYIPLCFYLYITVTNLDFISAMIYIPLCFYLYGAAFRQVALPAEFTFHYASTYTSQRTFPLSSIIHLHSTMLLLIQFVNQ